MVFMLSRVLNEHVKPRNNQATTTGEVRSVLR